MKLFDTICAPITVRGESSVAMVRISGANAVSVTEKIFTAQKPLSSYQGYSIVPGYLIREDGAKLDRCLAFVYRAPHSFTGEDSIELSFHGSPVITDIVMRLLLAHGVRTALPGEFTKRAFLNGKMTLTEAEAIIDVIQAKSEAVVTYAEENAQGVLDKKLRHYTDTLLNIYTLLNLSIDFDEEGLEHTDWSTILAQLQMVESHLAADSEDSGHALRDKRGVQIVISGRPNVGKSTLMNALLGKDRVLVSDIAGTTRDYVGEDVVIDGHYVKLYDSAGLRTTDDRLESLGIEKAKSITAQADIVLYVCDPDNPYDAEVFTAYTALGCTVIAVYNKCDILQGQIPKECIGIAAQSGKNIPFLRKQLSEAIAQLTFVGQKNGVFMTERQYDYCVRVHAKIKEAITLCISDRREEIVAGAVRGAIEDLDVLSGKKVTEEMLESIFNRFCIGK